MLPDGKQGHVQPVGDRPDQVGREDAQLYGVGALLLAGTAAADLQNAIPRLYDDITTPGR